jgi:hypothetical protein
MRTIFATLVVLTMIFATGCQTSSSSRGGSVSAGKGFRVEVPTFATTIKQGETRSIAISLDREYYFKQDITLKFSTSSANKGLSIEPATTVIKASERPSIQIRVTASTDAALGEYSIRAMGTPVTGEPTSTAFNVKIVAP